MPRLTLDEIEAGTRAALTRAGASAANAAPVARSVRQAEADDLSSVGLGYLPIYLAHLASGKVRGDARPVAAPGRAGTVSVDAAGGFAHPAADVGYPLLVAAARTCGVATLAVRNSYSIGVLGHCVEHLADHGLVALAVTNSPPNIAPWGGSKPFFGTSPMAFAAPRGGSAPLVIDQATSVVTKVALTARATRGEPLPEGWALDAAGAPTTDAQAAMKGSLLPFGGAKGAGLALLIDCLAGGLASANFSHEISPYAQAEGRPPGTGQFFIAFDPAAYADDFSTRIESLFAAMLAQQGVRLPGDRRLAARARATRDGVEITDAAFALIGGHGS